MNEWETVLDLLLHEGFLGGFAAGLVLLALFLIASLLTKRPVLVWAAGFSGAVAFVLSVQYSVDPLVLVSLGAVAVGGLSVDVAHSMSPGPVAYVTRAVTWALTGVSIVWFTSIANTADEGWIGVAFPLMVLTMGAAIWSYRFGLNANLLGPIIAVATIGVWVTVPETDRFTIVVGAALALALATLWPVRAKAAGVGAFALAGLIVWLTIGGGDARPLSVIGGWAAFGVLPMVPLLRGLGVSVNRRLVILGVHVFYAILVTRVVDVWDSIPVALSLIVILLVASGVALVEFGRREMADLSTEPAEASVT